MKFDITKIKMADLKGSDKQIKFAEDIRKMMLPILTIAGEYFINSSEESWKNHLTERRLKKYGNVENFKKGRIDRINKQIEDLFSIEESAWFIDNFGVISSYKGEYVTQAWFMKENFRYIEGFNTVNVSLIELNNDMHKFDYQIFNNNELKIRGLL